MELVEDYDYTINYHLGKATIVIDVLSRKFATFSGCLITTQSCILKDLRRMGIDLVPKQYTYMLSTLMI